MPRKGRSGGMCVNRGYYGSYHNRKTGKKGCYSFGGKKGTKGLHKSTLGRKLYKGKDGGVYYLSKNRRRYITKWARGEERKIKWSGGAYG